MLPDHTYQQAKTLARLSGATQNVFQLESGTYVIAPDGYDIPSGKITLIGKVDRNGNFTPNDTKSLLQRDQNTEHIPNSGLS